MISQIKVSNCFAWCITPWFVLALMITIFQGCGTEPELYQWDLPEGFPEPMVPVDNPMSDAKVTLGQQLFFDNKLSYNQLQSCSTCHQPDRAFSEARAVSVGSTGESLARNSMALVNVAYNSHYTWAHNGLVQIEQQIMIPLFSEAPLEMGVTGHEAEVLQRFQSPSYESLFEAAFGDSEVTFLRINYALASFVRQLLSFDSPFDKYAYQGQDDALTESQKRGLNLFFSERTECHHCHGGFNLSQSAVHQGQEMLRSQFHNTGLYNVDDKGAYPETDNGLYDVTFNTLDQGAFRAPTLRNIAHSAPYMHDGSLPTLSDVVAFYNVGGRHITEGQYQGDGRRNRFKSPFVKALDLTPQEQQDLVNFLGSLSDESFLTRYHQ